MIEVFSNTGHQHIIDLIRMFFALEESKKHSTENVNIDKASFISNLLVELLTQIVKNSIVEVQSVNLFDNLNPLFLPAIRFIKHLLDILVNYFGTHCIGSLCFTFQSVPILFGDNGFTFCFLGKLFLFIMFF